MNTLGKLTLLPALENLNLVGATVAPQLTSNVHVTAIDASLSDTAAFCEAYGIDPSVTCNCVIVETKREGKVSYAACISPATTKMDINKVVKKHLNAAKISFAPMETAVQLTNMEYGAITPIGLPADWPVLVDSRIVDLPRIVIGSGVRPSKLVLSGKTMIELSKGTVIEGLGK